VTRYRKRPVEVEARRVPTWTWSDTASAKAVGEFVDTCIALAAWCGGVSHMMESPFSSIPEGIHIPTLEGMMLAQPGDWIIRGVAGEFYPCRPDIFDATYEPIEP
jgi:hypothetical protein